MPHIQQVALHPERLHTAYDTFFFALVTARLSLTQP
jgi:hypothetical protein